MDGRAIARGGADVGEGPLGTRRVCLAIIAATFGTLAIALAIAVSPWKLPAPEQDSLLLWCSGVVFAAYATTALAGAGSLDRNSVPSFVIWTSLFPIWGFVIGLPFLVLGLLGIPQSVLTSWLLYRATESKVVAMAPVVGLVSAVGCFGVAFAISPKSGNEFDMYIWGWHLGAAAVMTTWSVRERLRNDRFRFRHYWCWSCGYSMTGLRTERCPECGTAFRGASAGKLPFAPSLPENAAREVRP